MNKWIKTAMALAVLALPVLAGAGQLFDFAGQAVVPETVGDQIVVRCVLNETVDPTPLPLDFASYEYTLVLTAQLDSLTAFSRYFGTGTIALYEDAGTPADPAAPETYTDGTLLLGGDLLGLTRNAYPTGIGSGTAHVDWNEGSRLDTFPEGDRYDWTLLISLDSTTGVAAGYDEVWEGTLEPASEITPAESLTWSELKSLY